MKKLYKYLPLIVLLTIGCNKPHKIKRIEIKSEKPIELKIGGTTENNKSYILGTWKSKKYEGAFAEDQILKLSKKQYSLTFTSLNKENNQDKLTVIATGDWKFDKKFIYLTPKSITNNGITSSAPNIIIKRKVTIAYPIHNGRMITTDANANEKTFWELH